MQHAPQLSRQFIVDLVDSWRFAGKWPARALERRDLTPRRRKQQIELDAAKTTPVPTNGLPP
jgi:hypothetical protein